MVQAIVLRMLKTPKNLEITLKPMTAANLGLRGIELICKQSVITKVLFTYKENSRKTKNTVFLL
jgi:hypothetical protein